MNSSLLYSCLPYFANRTAHVLVYHATFQDTPAILKDGLHNVTPEVLYQQLSWIRSHFDIVWIDDLFLSDDIRGKAAITIDDGYASFFSEGFPVFKALKVPCTMYLCGSTLEGKVFWRDKVRYLINNRLLPPFLDFLHESGQTDFGLTEENFYKRSKSAVVNSHALAALLDEFFETRGIRLEGLRFCVTRREELLSDPLLHYGNHSFDHYVLSSLSADEQEEQIGRNHEFLNHDGTDFSKIFSLPFGGEDDFNSTTLSILKTWGYVGLLMASGRINTRPERVDSLKRLHRYLPARNLSRFKTQAKKMVLKQLIGLS